MWKAHNQLYWKNYNILKRYRNEIDGRGVYSSKPTKILSFPTPKVDNVNVLCIDPATEKLTFYATKSSKSKENSQTSNQ